MVGLAVGLFGCSLAGPHSDATGAALIASLDHVEDKATVTSNAGRSVIDIVSPTGIGGATIAPAEGVWPAALEFRLHLRGLEYLEVSTDSAAVTVEVPSHGAGLPLVSIVWRDGAPPQDTGNRVDPPRISVSRVTDEKSAAGPAYSANGYFRVELAKELYESSTGLHLRWVDYFRG